MVVLEPGDGEAVRLDRMEKKKTEKGEWIPAKNALDGFRFKEAASLPQDFHTDQKVFFDRPKHA